MRVPVGYPLHESRGWRPDVDEMRRLVTDKTRAIYVNSPNNPTGGVLTRGDLEAIAALAREKNLWVISDEAYEDVVFEGEQLSIASLPGMYERTIPIYTMSKTYAITGLRLGYLAVRDPKIRERVRKVLFYTVSNTSSLVQYGARRRARRIATGRRRFPHGAARAASALLRRHRQSGAGHLQRRAAGWRVLRVPEESTRPGGRRCQARQSRSPGR